MTIKMFKKLFFAVVMTVALVFGGAPFAAHPEARTEMSTRLVIDHHKIPSYFIGEWCSGSYDAQSRKLIIGNCHR
jgi:hypothetical protein